MGENSRNLRFSFVDFSPVCFNLFFKRNHLLIQQPPLSTALFFCALFPKELWQRELTGLGVSLSCLLFSIPNWAFLPSTITQKVNGMHLSIYFPAVIFSVDTINVLSSYYLSSFSSYPFDSLSFK